MNKMQPEIHRAKPEDWDDIWQLLDDAGLPASDLAADELENFFVAIQHEQLVGIAGLQLAMPFGLLRSVVVRQEQRNRKLGRQLVAHCLGRAQEHLIKALFLIPNDDSAARFFGQLGFTLIERQLVPDQVRELSEFTHLCPQSYPCLHIELLHG